MAGGLELLKKRFVALEKHVSECKTAIQDRLKKSQCIDDDDTAGLMEALDALENASDYEQGVSHLSQGLQAAVQRMKEFAAGVKTSVSTSKVPGAKRKEPAQKPVIPPGKDTRYFTYTYTVILKK
ncbi:hypothetical protein B0H13DRAFT_1900844 [Mycena leptocephala]|nr:hypothetical protein B0H13DRAFT_1900844 [Mycena leptocephala]